MEMAQSLRKTEYQYHKGHNYISPVVLKVVARTLPAFAYSKLFADFFV